jgi:hypothetical protein
MLLFLQLLSIVFPAMAAETINFDSVRPGPPPPGWSIAMTHAGSAPRWVVQKDDTAPSKPNVLAQISTDRAAARCPLAIFNKVLKDGEISVKFKTIWGKQDQVAGLVWRYGDENNYYLVRANSLEQNIVLCKIQDGKRISLPPKGTAPKTYGVKHKVPFQAWSLLKVTFRGPVFEVYFDHRRVFRVEDNTFTQPGKVGLWTKADSVTYFDDFRIGSR